MDATKLVHAAFFAKRLTGSAQFLVAICTALVSSLMGGSGLHRLFRNQAK
jgi:hypothetical protein